MRGSLFFPIGFDGGKVRSGLAFGEKIFRREKSGFAGGFAGGFAILWCFLMVKTW
jgi:hypothetical protein